MKKIYLFILAIFFLQAYCFAQNIGINADGSAPNPNAMLDIKSNTKGLLIPRTSTTSRIVIPNTKGLLVYDTTQASFWYNDGAAWQQIANGAALNGTLNYIPKFLGTTFLGNSQIIDNGQNVGIGTNTPLAHLQVAEDNVLFSAAGDIPASLQNTPNTGGPARRLLWYADKAAFRVGFAASSEWDSAGIGKYSIGMGNETMAKGIYSMAVGNVCVASGIASFSAGENNDASGDYSVCFGQNNSATNNYTFAAGYSSYASGSSSIALGYQAQATGNYSFAIGYGAQASKDYSYAIGQGTSIGAANSIAMGYFTNTSGLYSMATNFRTIASGNSSFACGGNTIAGGTYSFAGGASCVANGASSVAMGNNNLASGNFSFTAGSDSKANKELSVAIGSSVISDGVSAIALGSNVTAGGDNSFVWGINSNTTGSSSFILGTNLFDGGHKGDAMLGDTDPWGAGSVGSGSDNQMVCRFNNGYYFLTGGNTNRSGMIANHGDNSWSQISDSTKKEKLIPVNGEDLLKKISNFKLTTWNYKGQDSKIFRHYGPMAQDFHNAFGHDALGTIGNDTLINQADFLGVSFTAIQALEKRTEKIEQQQSEIENLKKENVSLADNNQKMQDQIKTLLSAYALLNKKVETLASEGKKLNSIVKK